jgi:hypothetical protein
MSMGCFGGLCAPPPTLASLKKNFQEWYARNGRHIRRYSNNTGIRAYNKFQNNLRTAIENAGGNGTGLNTTRANRNLARQWSALKRVGKQAREKYNKSNAGRAAYGASIRGGHY